MTGYLAHRQPGARGTTETIELSDAFGSVGDPTLKQCDGYSP